MLFRSITAGHLRRKRGPAPQIIRDWRAERRPRAARHEPKVCAFRRAIPSSRGGPKARLEESMRGEISKPRTLARHGKELACLVAAHATHSIVGRSGVALRRWGGGLLSPPPREGEGWSSLYGHSRDMRSPCRDGGASGVWATRPSMRGWRAERRKPMARALRHAGAFRRATRGDLTTPGRAFAVSVPLARLFFLF